MIWLDVLFVVISAAVSAIVREVFRRFIAQKETVDVPVDSPDYVAVGLGNDGLVCVSFGDVDPDDPEVVDYQLRWLSVDHAEFLGREIVAAVERSRANSADRDRG